MSSLDILLPFYGDVGYLRLAVASVLAQTDTDWRLVVVDDGYPDPGVATWFAGLDDSRVHYTRNETNLGANGNYRRALTLAEAEWVVVMGADDLMLPTYVATVRALIATHPQADIVQPGVQVVDDAGAVIRPLADRIKAALAPRGEQVLAGERLSASLLRANWTYFPALCWRLEAITTVGFRPGLDIVQDLALLLDVAAQGGCLVKGGPIAFQYRRHVASDSSVRAISGSRFVEERAFFAGMERENIARRWPSAARSAKWHLTSRLHAASLLPTATRAGGWSAVATLLRHALR